MKQVASSPVFTVGQPVSFSLNHRHVSATIIEAGVGGEDGHYRLQTGMGIKVTREGKFLTPLPGPTSGKGD